MKTNKKRISVLLLLCFLSIIGSAQTQSIELDFIVPPVKNTKDATPSFVFNSTAAGTLSLGGGLKTPTTKVDVGYNYITLDKISNGTYSDCYIMVTTENGQTGKLNIGTITVNAPEDKHLWNSIRTAGFDYDDVAVTTKESAEWLAKRHDIVITGTVQRPDAYNYMKTANPHVKLFGYISMYTTVATWLEKWCEERGIDPEELYYHYEEDTELLSVDGPVTTPGYGPNGSAKTLKESRVRTFYSAAYPIFCPTSKVFCEAYRDYVWTLTVVNEEEGKYLDGHFMDGLVGNVWNGRDFHLENSIEMRALGCNTPETAKRRSADDIIEMRNHIEQYIEATIGQEYSISGNISEANFISEYNYLAKDRFDHVYNEVTVEYITNLVRMRIFDIINLIDIYEAMERGVIVIANSETNYYDKPEKYTNESWAAFIQFTLAAQMLIAHDNGYFSYHRGSASYYGGWPEKGDLTNSHWHINREYDLGKPVVRNGKDYWGKTGTDRFYLFAEGTVEADLGNNKTEIQKYKIIAREFEKGLVLANYGHDTNTVSPMGCNLVTIDLNGKYRQLQEDNSLGQEITQITLGKAHGAILVKSN